MTIAYVSKNMTVQNPIGYLPVHPPPAGLPSGLVSLHLLRKNITLMSLNQVDGSFVNFEEVAPEGEVVYGETFVETTHRLAGWSAPDYRIPYETGFTWCVVGQHVSSDDGIHIAVSTANINSQLSIGERIDFREDTARFYTRRSDGNAEQAISEFFTPPSGQYMVFGGMGPSDGANDLPAAICVPHRGDYVSNMLSAPSSFGDPAGLALCREARPSYPTGTVDENKTSLYMMWDRFLSEGEIMAAYSRLKPWLAARGVEIP